MPARCHARGETTHGRSVGGRIPSAMRPIHEGDARRGRGYGLSMTRLRRLDAVAPPWMGDGALIVHRPEQAGKRPDGLGAFDPGV